MPPTVPGSSIFWMEGKFKKTFVWPNGLVAAKNDNFSGELCKRYEKLFWHIDNSFFSSIKGLFMELLKRTENGTGKRILSKAQIIVT